MTQGTVLDHDWYPAPLPDNVSIGSESWLYSSYAFLHYRSERPTGVRVGAHSGVYNGTFFDLGRRGEVVIGDYCAVVGATFSTNGRVEIKDYAFLAHEVVIADNAFARPVAEGQPEFASTNVVIGTNAWIGARALLIGSTTIGEGAIVGAGAVVRGDIPDYAIAAGNPASVVGWARPAGG
jgi:acetyltransferase-like isoleucine patch superfamily enzyme